LECRRINIYVLFTLMAATVGYEDPKSWSHTSCRVVQKLLTLSGFGLYISMMSRPAENTVGELYR